ncbi:MAG: transglutaminase family protein [Panacibacter sp.]
MPIFTIHHITKYEYDRPVRESVNEIRIVPYKDNDQKIESQKITVTSNPDIQYFTDYWGNKAGVFSVLQLHSNLTIESQLVVNNNASSQSHINFQTGFDQLKKEKSSNLRLLELSNTDTIKNQAAINEIVQTILGDGKSVALVVSRCAEYIFQYFSYIKGITNIETTVDEILAHRSGVCQDFAHLMLQILGTLKIPSRYVSGYICPNKNGMRGEGATHAWVDAHIPGYGWAGIDPTNNVWVTNNHVKLAVGRHFNDCSPIKGTFKGPAKQKLSVHVSIGYEDGHLFEEVNNVQMEMLSSNAKDKYIEAHFAGQQQQ